MATVEYLRLDLMHATSLTNAAQVGCAISANSGDAVAALTTLGAEDGGSALTRIRIRRVGARMIEESEDGHCAGKENDTRAYCASERTRHVRSILSYPQSSFPMPAAKAIILRQRYL